MYLSGSRCKLSNPSVGFFIQHDMACGVCSESGFAGPSAGDGYGLLKLHIFRFKIQKKYQTKRSGALVFQGTMSEGSQLSSRNWQKVLTSRETTLLEHSRMKIPRLSNSQCFCNLFHCSPLTCDARVFSRETKLLTRPCTN